MTDAYERLYRRRLEHEISPEREAARSLVPIAVNAEPAGIDELSLEPRTREVESSIARSSSAIATLHPGSSPDSR
ncbi:MAG TPA: hypothetical protein VGK63_10365, partial [Candidatus Limnocylindrales bacterium]